MTQLPPTAILRNGLRLLVPISIALTVYLYLFPVFNTCAFPLPPSDGSAHGVDTGLVAYRETAKEHLADLGLGSLHFNLTAKTSNASSNPTSPSTSTTAVPRRPLAPFRLLALGDPQLEGDTSIPNANGNSLPHLSSIVRHLTWKTWHGSLSSRIRAVLHDMIDFYFEDVPNELESYRKRVDLFGNDFYLAHIYCTVRWWTRPTHVAVLGDLLGSQWVDDDEFQRRADRYWSRVFRGAERVPDHVARMPGNEYDLAGYLGPEGPQRQDDDGVIKNETAEAWTRRIINVVGNHDIGYAGDINEERVSRFEKAFGRMNYELRFELPVTDPARARSVFHEVTNRDSDRLAPELRVVVANDMNLDTPAASTDLQDDTYVFINSVITTASAVEFKGHFTVLLTHVPLHKPEGVCADAPFFDFHEDGTLKEQNLLSDAASGGFLEGIFGMNGDANAAANGRGRPGVILDGHDHVGCDTWHFINQSHGESGEDRKWDAKRWRQAQKLGLVGQAGLPGIREITVRSMMGDFGGNAGLLSVWFDEESWEWHYEYATCPMGTQHLWWVVHIVDLITIVAVLLYAEVALLSAVGLDVDKIIIGFFLSKNVGETKVNGIETKVNGAVGNGEVKKLRAWTPS